MRQYRAALRRPAALALLAVLTGGCADFDVDEFLWGTPAQQAEFARTSSDLALCRYLRDYQSASVEVRRQWADEISRRGQNCAWYPDPLAAEEVRGHGRTGGGTAYYKGERVSGTSRICRYDRLGSAVVVTVPRSDLCPLTLP